MPTIERTLDARVATLERELAEIKALLKEQVSKTQPVGAAVMAAAAAASGTSTVVKSVKAAEPAPAASAAPAKEEGISPEIMAVISAAVTHFLGLRARIRHARLVQPMATNPWAQQGRVFIQASHNLSR